MNENRNNSYLFSSKKSTPALRTCTSCCPFDTQNLPHPQFNYSSIKQTDINGNRIITNTDACCLTKLQVDCRIQCQKKKKKHKKNKRYDSIHSSLSTKRSISSSSSSSIQQRKKFTNTNSHFIHTYDSQTSSSASSNTNESRYRYHHKSMNAEQSQSRFYINENIQNLKTSIDNLTQLLVHHQKPSPLISFLDKFRRFFSSSKSTDNQMNEECYQILQRNHLTKQNLLHIYHLFNKNEILFLNWLRTIMPEYFLPLLLNYVKHFDSISTDND